MTSERDLLKPCPMCGAIEGQNGLWLNPDGRYVACQTCGISTRDYDTNAEAIAAWNRRAQHSTAEPVGEAGTMPGTSGFTMACFHADKVPLGTKLYAAPQQAPLTDEQIDAATNQARDALLDHIYEYDTLSEGITRLVRRLARTVEAAHGIGPAKETSNG